MPDIPVAGPDGAVHMFPEGTPYAVIDRLMAESAAPKRPSSQKPQPAGQITESSAPAPHPADRMAGAYQARPGGPVLNVQDSPLRSAALGAERMMGIENPQSLWDALRQAGASFADFAKGSYEDWQQGLQREAHGMVPDIVTKPLAAMMTPIDMAARGIEGLASGIEGSSKDIASGLGYRKGDMVTPSGPADPRSVSYGLGSMLALRTMARDPEALKDFGSKLSEAGRLLERQDAINRGQVQVVNAHVQDPLNKLDDKVSKEIGAHVKAGVNADQAHMQATGAQTGLVNAADASVRTYEKLGKMKITLAPQFIDLIDRAASPMTLNEAKQLTTDVGHAAAGLKRQGNFRAYAVLNELYDGLHKATQARADELDRLGVGRGIGNSWKQYINLTSAYKGLQEGLLGELMDEPVHAKVMGKIIDPSRATEWNEIRDELKKRGIDTTGFEKARKYAKSMAELQTQTRNLFIGKIRGIMRHPLLAGGAAIGAAMLGHASGIPLLGYVLPLIAAAKVSNLLDDQAMGGLLSEINRSVPAEAGRVGEALPAPVGPGTVREPLSNPSPSPAATPPPRQPGGAPSAGGLIDKGEVVKGSGVRQYEIAGQEGKTVAVSPKKMAELGSQQALEEYVRNEVAKKATAPTAAELKNRMMQDKPPSRIEKAMDLAQQISELKKENAQIRQRLESTGNLLTDEETAQAEKRIEENVRRIKELHAKKK